ncbi:hypothetical protein [Enterobacter hormaechei]|uniref:hypothetical protein n=1 Tax=Enterobacter hormaechei TaxID=158836 RepID=UPI002A753957|nr:hypothetical protein [Enterobacter hormaechei]MDY3572327.1 hypothetical protein [Enterobacter hormaechei]
MNTPSGKLTPHCEAHKSKTEEYPPEDAEFFRFMDRLITGFRCNAVEDAGRISAMVSQLCSMPQEQQEQAIKILGREISLGSAEMRHHGLYGYPWDKR